MKDQYKTKAQLIRELNELRNRFTAVDGSGSHHEVEKANGSAGAIGVGEKGRVALNIFKTISDRVLMGLVIANLDGSMIYVNDHYATMHGYNIDEMIGKPFTLCHTGDQIGEITKANQESLKTGQFDFREIWHKRKDGTVFPTLMSGVTIKDNDGKPTHMTASAIDITERNRLEVQLNKHHHELEETVASITSELESAKLDLEIDIRKRKVIETALRNSEHQFRSLVEDSQYFIWQSDVNGKFTYLSPAWETLLGYQLDEMIGHHFSEFKPPEVEQQAQEMFRTILEGKKIYGYETVYISKSGEERFLGFNAQFLEDSEGRHIGSQGTAHDLTDKISALKELKANEYESEQRKILLKEKNITLRELIRQVDTGKRAVQHQINSNIDQLVIPIIDRLREYGDVQMQKGLQLLQDTLQELPSYTGAEWHRISSLLTPKELEIAHMISNGFSSKEIASTLHLSPKTIYTHRSNIRKKMDIRKKGINMVSFLRSKSLPDNTM